VSVFRAIVFSAFVAGIAAGSAVTVAQQLGTVPMILKGEVYETAADTASDRAATGETAKEAGAAQQHSANEYGNEHSAGPEHHETAWEPKEGWERNGLTGAANILTSIGFALLLGGIYALRRHVVTWHEGLLWGLAGFVAFTVAPGLGLPPELPGVPTAPLEPRQIWWIATAAATALGLGLVFLKRSLWASVLGLILIVLPHLIGAPHLEEVHTNVPTALSHQFVVAVTLTSLLSWALLGSLTAVAYARLSVGSPAPIANIRQARPFPTDEMP
jgi:cobalt transporter subunit CbtA